MTQKGQRAFALIIAVAFFISTVAFTGLVIWELTRADQQPGDSALNADENNKVTSQEGQLEGTKLEGFTPVNKIEKLQVIDLNKGNGAEVKANSTITAHYTGALAKDGTIFQSSHDGPGQPFTTQLSGVIEGWQKGLPGMKVGGKRRLIVPADLAYGNQSPSPNIPANSDLVFDIELLAVE